MTRDLIKMSGQGRLFWRSDIYFWSGYQGGSSCVKIWWKDISGTGNDPKVEMISICSKSRNNSRSIVNEGKSDEKRAKEDACIM